MHVLPMRSPAYPAYGLIARPSPSLPDVRFFTRVRTAQSTFRSSVHLFTALYSKHAYESPSSRRQGQQSSSENTASFIRYHAAHTAFNADPITLLDNLKKLNKRRHTLTGSLANMQLSWLLAQPPCENRVVRLQGKWLALSS